jgi:hypothetical protein
MQLDGMNPQKFRSTLSRISSSSSPALMREVISAEPLDLAVARPRAGSGHDCRRYVSR